METAGFIQSEEKDLFKDFKNAGDFIFCADAAGNFKNFNQIAEKITGYSSQELRAMSFDDLLAPESAEKFSDLFFERASSLNENIFDTEIVTKNGKRIYLEINYWREPENGKPGGVRAIARDITIWKQKEKLLLLSELQNRNIVESASEVIVTVDRDNKIIFINSAVEKVFGYPVGELNGDEIFRLMPKNFRRKYLKLISNYTTKTDARIAKNSFEWVGLHKNGSEFSVEIAFGEFNREDERLFTAIIRDISGRKEAERRLRESENKLRMLLSNMTEGLVQVRNGDEIEFVNDRFCEMLGYTREELLNKSPRDLFLDEESVRLVAEANRQRLEGKSSRYEIRLRKKTGEALWVIVGGSPITDESGSVTGSLGVFTDITARKQTEERMLHDALHDNLTGLANRMLFNDHLQMTIERGKRNSQNQFAVLFLDFDRFKVINDSLGHAEGDNLLKQIARRLELSLRAGDLLARLGGDEFTILLNELSGADDAAQIAERIQEDLKDCFKLGEQEIFISASIGIALSSIGYHRAADMLRDADIAMYRAKAKGKARYQIFDRQMHLHATTQLQLDTEMRHALQRGEFSLFYQPIVNLETESLAGFEALIRWHHPERGLISPVEFIAAAEENNLIIPLGRWILYESCRQLNAWQREIPWTSSLSISVNISSKQFLQPDLTEQVAAALISTRLEPSCLKVEITESHVMENSDRAVAMMNRLREIGVEISLDDFGTGYSSLSYLHRLPVNYLKIDRSFVSRMVESRENGEIVYTIVKLAQNLKMKVIAEGIENVSQLAHLKMLGCNFGQGYYFSEPLSADEAQNFLIQQIGQKSFNLNLPLISAEMNM